MKKKNKEIFAFDFYISKCPKFNIDVAIFYKDNSVKFFHYDNQTAHSFHALCINFITRYWDDSVYRIVLEDRDTFDRFDCNNYNSLTSNS